MAEQRHARLTIEVEVHKIASNEADPWIPPSARQVAAFVQDRLNRVEHDGWYVGIVTESESG